MKTKKYGFTLIELLVVISIIAVLMSILMPSLGRARNSAKAVVCSTNLKQLSMGVLMYCQSHNGTKLEMVYGGDHWINKIAPYMGEANVSNSDSTASGERALQVARCPSTKQNDSSYYGSRGSYTHRWSYGKGGGKVAIEGSYAINKWATKDTQYDSWFPKDNFFKQKYDTIKGNVPIFADSVWIDAYPFDQVSWSTDYDPVTVAKKTGSYFHFPDSWSGTPASQMGRFQIDRHNMSVNAGFIDGHAEKLKLENLWSIPWNSKWKMTNVAELPGR